MRNMPIWKQIFTMLAKARYLGSPIVFVVPGGLVVTQTVLVEDELDD